jgi:hypothetical protein
MFATLLGPLPRPALPGDAPPEAVLDAILAAQAEAGIEPLTDGGWPLVHDPVLAWRRTAARTSGAVKAVLRGPFTGGIARGGSVEPWRMSLEALADAGCPLVEIAEPDAVAIGPDIAERGRFLDLHERLLAGFDGLHCSLAVTGGAADAAGAETILGPPYASLAVDLIAGPDNWRLVTAVPRERGVICGVVETTEAGGEGPEVLLWALAYASGSQGRGSDRVGLATASSLAHLSWGAARRKLARLGEALELARLPKEDLLARIDPRAIDSRSAALGRYEPPPDDRRGA